MNDVSYLVNNFDKSKNQFDKCIFNINCNDESSRTTINESVSQQTIDESNPQEIVK